MITLIYVKKCITILNDLMNEFSVLFEFSSIFHMAFLFFFT